MSSTLEAPTPCSAKTCSAARLAAGAGDLDTGPASLHAGSVDLATGLRDGLRSIPDPTEEQRTAVAQTLGNTWTAARVQPELVAP